MRLTSPAASPPRICGAGVEEVVVAASPPQAQGGAGTLGWQCPSAPTGCARPTRSDAWRLIGSAAVESPALGPFSFAASRLPPAKRRRGI